MKASPLLLVCIASVAFAGSAREESSGPRKSPREQAQAGAEARSGARNLRKQQAQVRLQTAGFYPAEVKTLLDSLEPHSPEFTATRTLMSFAMRPAVGAKAKMVARNTLRAAIDAAQNPGYVSSPEGVSDVFGVPMLSIPELDVEQMVLSIPPGSSKAQWAARVRALLFLRDAFGLPSTSALEVSSTRSDLEAMLPQSDAETRRLLEAVLVLHPALQVQE